MNKLATLILLMLFCCLTYAGQESAASGSGTIAVNEIYLAKDDGSGNAGEPASGFITTDVPIYCVVQLDSAATVTVKMNLVAVAVPGVKSETRVVSASYTTRDNQDRVNFTGRPAGQWVAGRYRVEIFVGDQPVITREFTIQKAAQGKPAAKPGAPRPADKSRLAERVKKV